MTDTQLPQETLHTRFDFVADRPDLVHGEPAGPGRALWSESAKPIGMQINDPSVIAVPVSVWLGLTDGLSE
jgi:hypothetical protein